MAIGVVCGDKDIMSLADPVSIREKEARCAIGGGTFSANPATMAAGLATLDFLKKNERKVYGKIDKLGAMARKGLDKIFADAKIPCRVTGTNSVFLTHFVKEGTTGVENATDVATSDRGKLVKYHMALMAEHGVFFLPTKMGAISYAHDEADVKRLLSATEKIASSGVLK
jgi:glutamate-1-semialdehyde 2,1-aminomutase